MSTEYTKTDKTVPASQSLEVLIAPACLGCLSRWDQRIRWSDSEIATPRSFSTGRCGLLQGAKILCNTITAVVPLSTAVSTQHINTWTQPPTFMFLDSSTGRCSTYTLSFKRSAVTDLLSVDCWSGWKTCAVAQHYQHPTKSSETPFSMKPTIIALALVGATLASAQAT
jgi:hypothetical protein